MSYPYYGAVPSKNRDGSGDSNKRTFLSPTMIGLICVGVVAGGVWVNHSVQTYTSSTSIKATSMSKKATGSPIIDYTLVRAMYEPLPFFEDTYDSYLNYEFLKNFDAIVEPHQTMNLHFYNADVSAGNYVFEICPEGSKENCQQGYSLSSMEQKGTAMKGVKFQCSTYTRYDMTLSTLDNAGNVVAMQPGKALCLYVRREIRSLTPSDLRAYMDANYVMYSTSDEDGQKKYGPEFHNNTYFMRFHHFNSALRDSDHIHEGNGFLTQHLKLTNMFDSAVQVIDPSQSIPYWDFTIDHADGRRPYESYILTAETYGSMNLPQNKTRGYEYDVDKINDARISDGRWKDLKADVNYYYPELDYGYGYMRGPWNMNPSPYVTRFSFDFNDNLVLPSCESHYDALQFDDMMDFFYWNSFSPHSKTHTTFAGFYGCDKFYSLVEAGIISSEYEARLICSSWSFYTKEFWRRNFIEPKSNCSKAEPLEKSYCGFECVEENVDEMVSFLLPQISSYLNQDNIDSASTALKDFVCNGEAGYIFTGDHLESASPGDPSFWVIHPTLERLFHAKLMAGGFTSETWSTDQQNDFVCSKGACYSDALDTTDYFDSCCYGHRETDRMLDAISGNRFAYVGLTNGEVLSMGDPRSESYSMPYIYDNFDWSHCETNGYHFMTLLDTMKEEADTRTDTSTDKTASEPTLKGVEKKSLSKEQIQIKNRKEMFRNWNKAAKEWGDKKMAIKKAKLEAAPKP